MGFENLEWLLYCIAIWIGFSWIRTLLYSISVGDGKSVWYSITTKTRIKCGPVFCFDLWGLGTFALYK